MSDNFRVVECLATPSQLFCIYDYTKIAYLVQDYICIREVVTEEAMPNFIKLQNYSFSHNHLQRYIGFASFPNCLVLAERAANRDITLHFYTHNELHIKIPSEMGRRAESDSELKIEMHQSQRYIYLIVKRQIDVEILVVDFQHRHFAGRGFISGLVEQFRVKHVQGLEIFSFFSRDSQQIVEYEVIPVLKEDRSVRIAQKNNIQIVWKDIMYCWAADELILATNDSIHVLIEGKQAQVIQNFHNISMVTNMISGFMVLNNLYLRLYKKNSSLYELILQFSLPCHPSSHLQLSPQEDMLAFYCEKTKAICYSCEFNYVGEQGVSRKPTEELPLYYINHYKQNQIKTYSSQLPLFVISTASILSIYSPVTFKCFLSMRANVRELSLTKKRLMRSTSLVSDKMLNEIGEGELIETAGINPMQQMVAVAFRSTVRVYFVLYNEFKVVKDIKMTHCKEIGFNHSGSIMYCKVGGKQGNKIYLYNVLRHFQCIEVLSASKPVEMMLWTPLDNQIFGFHQYGYYFWSVDTCFKMRHENTSALSFCIRGAVIYHNSMIVWGQNEILQLQNNSIIQCIRMDKKITNLIVQSNNFIIATEHGELYRCKGFSNILTTLSGHQSFKIGVETRIYSVGSGIVLCLNQQGNILCVQWGGDDKLGLQVVGIQRRRIEKYQSEYAKYDLKIKDLQEKMVHQLQMLKDQFHKRQTQQRGRFMMEIKDKEERYMQIRAQKVKTEHMLDENMRTHEHETLQQVKEIERMYERKMAITTNKLLTSEEIAFRNQVLAKQNLHLLEQKHSEDIVCVREEYSKTLQRQLSQGDQRQELYQIKKQYETKLSELQQQNENLLKRFQNVTEGNIVNLKKNVVNLEVKYGEAVSQKYNLLKEFEEERIQLEVMRTKNNQLQAKLEEETRRAQHLTRQYGRIQDLVVEKDNTIVCLQKRIQELEKSNEIFKYRIIEMKNISDPKQEEILKLKDNMIELEEEYEKMSKKAHQHEQTVSLLKKDVSQLRQTLASTQVRERKLDKDYGIVMDKLREATKAPIQEIRKMLIRILEIFQNAGEMKTHQQQKRPGSPLGELNRVREHLEVCLIEAVEIGKKNDKQNNLQISRKNRQNSQLLKQINDLRVKVRDLQTKLKEREAQLQQIERESRQFTSSVKKDRPSTNYQTEVQQPGRYKTRESFFQKSLFKGHWKEKRLKTQQGSRSKKSTHSFVKHETNHLYIQTKGQEVQELRRLLQQKQTIIKQLINKIHKLS